jgi:hypothetical protein
MERILIAALLVGTSAPALAWTYATDDGRPVTLTQVKRDGAACDTILTGRMVDNPRTAFTSCMQAKGYIVTFTCSGFPWYTCK